MKEKIDVVYKVHEITVIKKEQEGEEMTSLRLSNKGN